MKYGITGASGFLGQSLSKFWQSKGIELLYFGRSREKLKKIFGANVQVLQWDEINHKNGDQIKDLKVIINLAGESIAEKRWTQDQKKKIINSRIECTQILSQLCATLKNNSPVLLSASAVGIYGTQKNIKKGLPEAVTEKSPIAEENRNEFLPDVCRQWEAATAQAKSAGVRVIHLRLGVVLAAKGGALPKMAAPFAFLLGGPLGAGDQPVPWISLDDVVSAIDFIAENSQSFTGPVNLVSPECVSQRDFAKILGRVLDKPSFVKTPEFVLKALLGEMASELLLGGQHVYPSKLIDEKYSFLSSHLEDALKAIYKKI